VRDVVVVPDVEEDGGGGCAPRGGGGLVWVWEGGGKGDEWRRTYQVIMKEAKYATCRSFLTSMAA